MKDVQLLQALQVTLPRHKWDYNLWISLLEVSSVLQRFVGTISCSKLCMELWGDWGNWSWMIWNSSGILNRIPAEFFSRCWYNPCFTYKLFMRDSGFQCLVLVVLFILTSCHGVGVFRTRYCSVRMWRWELWADVDFQKVLFWNKKQLLQGHSWHVVTLLFKHWALTGGNFELGSFCPSLTVVEPAEMSE